MSSAHRSRSDRCTDLGAHRHHPPHDDSGHHRIIDRNAYTGHHSDSDHGDDGHGCAAAHPNVDTRSRTVCGATRCGHPVPGGKRRGARRRA